MTLSIYLNEQIYLHLFGVKPWKDISTIIKKNSEKLLVVGDFSFPSNSQIWKMNSLRETNSMPDEILANQTNKNDLIENSKSWLIKIKEIKLINSRYILFLERFSTISYLLREVLENDNYGKYRIDTIFNVDAEVDENDSLTSFRSLLISKVIQNLLIFCNANDDADLVDSKIATKITFYSMARKGNRVNSKQNTTLFSPCGAVLDPMHNKKETKLKYSEYLSLRTTDMQLIAMHKYGIRINDNKRLKTLINELGNAAVVIDLLEVKFSSPVLVIRTGQGNSKGASFILYNSARLETILRTYNERVDTGFYPKLPSLREIDTSLLKEEEEWQLVFNYIFTFPDLIRRILYGLENGSCAPHLMPKYLSGLVSLFSMYYKRVKILTANRGHLLPTLFSRIHLLKCIQKILNISLRILDIKPIQQM